MPLSTWDPKNLCSLLRTLLIKYFLNFLELLFLWYNWGANSVKALLIDLSPFHRYFRCWPRWPRTTSTWTRRRRRRWSRRCRAASCRASASASASSRWRRARSRWRTGEEKSQLLFLSRSISENWLFSFPIILLFKSQFKHIWCLGSILLRLIFLSQEGRPGLFQSACQQHLKLVWTRLGTSACFCELSLLPCDFKDRHSIEKDFQQTWFQQASTYEWWRLKSSTQIRCPAAQPGQEALWPQCLFFNQSVLIKPVLSPSNTARNSYPSRSEEVEIL